MSGLPIRPRGKPEGEKNWPALELSKGSVCIDQSSGRSRADVSDEM